MMFEASTVLRDVLDLASGLKLRFLRICFQRFVNILVHFIREKSNHIYDQCQTELESKILLVTSLSLETLFF